MGTILQERVYYQSAADRVKVVYKKLLGLGAVRGGLPDCAWLEGLGVGARLQGERVAYRQGWHGGRGET